MDDESTALLKLVLAGGAAIPRRGLLDAHQTASQSLTAGASAWRAAGLNDTQVQRLRRPDDESYARGMRWLQQAGHHLIGWQDPDYPALLRRINSPPLALFVDGDPTLLWNAAVAVVGSRSPTAGGRDNATAFSHALATAGIAVTSGLAAGIDAAAHHAALRVAGGGTVAVLGTGPDLAYPSSHTDLRNRVAAQGAVVSEYPPGSTARPAHFPSRNRILAGLTLGTLVVEATERSGALITARQAGDAGREVFAIPGSIHNPLARGCHRLIRDGAALVETAQEVLDALVPMAGELAECLRSRLAGAVPRPHIGIGSASGPLNPDYQPLWLALGHDPTGMDSLVERTGLTPAELSSMLLVMELDGRVAVEHGRYSRKT